MGKILVVDDNEINRKVKNYSINKSDLDKNIDTDYISKNISQIVYISAAQGDGLKDLVEAIEKVVGTNNFNPSEAILSNERQRDSANRALMSVKEAKDALMMGMTFDAVTVSLEEAISSLLELTGERASEEIVDKVFHNFCVGK